MPIQIKAPDGSIAQFPDGTPDSTITSVMAKAYPQPSLLDRAIASPIGRLAHDFVGGLIKGVTYGPDRMVQAVLPVLGQPAIAPIQTAVDQPYEGTLARNRNAPGYADARAQADTVAQKRGSGGFMDQMIAPLAPAIAGTAGLFGGMNASNAAADAQAAAQADFATRHPIVATGAQILGGALAGPQSAASRLPRAASDFGFETRMIGNGNAPLLAPPLSPRDAALAHVSNIVKSSGKTPADLAAITTTKPLTAAEATGHAAEVDLGALARREGATPDALSGLVRARSEAAPTRILSDYAAASGIDPLAARGDIEGFIDSNQKAAAPLYDEAYKANTNIASPMLDRILATPAGKKALADARVKMQNDMSLMGTPDADLMEQAAEGGTPIPTRGVASGMKLRVYDYVKKSLDDQISAAFQAGNKNEGTIIKDLKNKLVNALDAADVTAQTGPNSVRPDGGAYARARAKAGEYLSAKQQFENGQQQILDNSQPALDFQRHYAGLGDAEKQAFLGGVANKLFNIQQAGKMKAALFKAPVIQQKLATVMGPENAAAFLKNMETEQAMALFARRAPGVNSPTAEYQAAMGPQDGSSALSMDALNLAAAAASKGPVRAAADLAASKAKDAAAAYLTRGMSIPVRDEAGRLWMLPPKDLAAALTSSSSLPQIPAATALPPLPLGMFGSGTIAAGRH